MQDERAMHRLPKVEEEHRWRSIMLSRGTLRTRLRKPVRLFVCYSVKPRTKPARAVKASTVVPHRTVHKVGTMHALDNIKLHLPIRWLCARVESSRVETRRDAGRRLVGVFDRRANAKFLAKATPRKIARACATSPCESCDCDNSTTTPY